MSTRGPERIGIVGLGAIGGSLALALRDRASVLAWARDGGDRASASAAGIRVCRESDSTWIADMASTTMVVLAVPLSELASVTRELTRRLPDEVLLLHTASLQRRDALGLTEKEFGRVLGTHPIAGSERSGFSAADAGMFRNATVRAESRATEDQRRRIEMFWRDVGISRIAWGDADAHDQLMSWISHLPQLAATALAAVLAQEGIAPRDVGPGARDATRLASSDFGMWAPILRDAPPETVAAVRRLASTLDAFGDALERRDSTSMATSWDAARTWRTSLEKPS